jgi:hypothetical protein
MIFRCLKITSLKTEIKRISIGSQPGQIVPQDLISKNPTQKKGLEE